MSNINFFRILQSGGGESNTPFTDQGQDTFRITYTWQQGDGGTDLDTLTGIAPGTGTSYDGTLNSSATGFAGYGAGSYEGPGNFASGNYFLDIAVELWKGGTWSDQGTVWANSGGTLEETISFSLSCLKGTGIGNRLDFSKPPSTTYKYMGKLVFTSNGTGYIAFNLSQ